MLDKSRIKMYTKCKEVEMIRTQINITVKQKQQLDNKSKETGLSISELLRRMIDEHFEKHDYKYRVS